MASDPHKNQLTFPEKRPAYRSLKDHFECQQDLSKSTETVPIKMKVP